MKPSNKKSRFSNLINAIVPLKSTTAEIYSKRLSFTAFYLCFSGITIITFLFSSVFTYIEPEITLEIGITLKTEWIYLPVFIIVAIIAILFSKPTWINKVLYILIPISIVMIIINYLVASFSYNPSLYVFTIIIISGTTSFLIVSSLIIFLYAINSFERIIIIVTIIVYIALSITVKANTKFDNALFSDLILPCFIATITYISMFFIDHLIFTKIEFNNEKIPTSVFIYTFFYIIVVIVFAFIISLIMSPRNLDISLIKNGLTFTYVGLVVGIITALIIVMVTRYFNIFLTVFWAGSALLALQCYILYIYKGGFSIFAILELLCGLELAFAVTSITMILGSIIEDKANYNIIKYILLGLVCVTASIVSVNYQVENTSIINVVPISQLILVIISIVTIIAFTRNLFNANKQPVVLIKEEDFDTIIMNEKYKNPYEVLTPKEIMIFEHLMQGLTLRQISGELKMKYDTVNFHYKNIYRKLDVNSRIELFVRYAKKE